MSIRRRFFLPMRLQQRGEINVLAIPLTLMVLFFVAAAGFGYWAFTSRQEYKNHADVKIAAAVEVAKKATIIEKDQAFAEAYKKPLTEYVGPEAYGSIHVEYPKTWSVYINSTVTQPQPLDAFFNAQTVPSVSDTASVFGLRVKVLPTQYAAVIKALDSKVKTKTVTVTPFSLAKVPGEVGVRVDGQILQGKKTTGSMVIFRLRDKTIQVWTENAQSLPDFNNIILPGLSFQP